MELDKFEGRDREFEVGCIPDDIVKLSEKIEDLDTRTQFINAVCHTSMIGFDFANQTMRAVAKTYAMPFDDGELYKIRDRVISHAISDLKYAFECYSGVEDVPNLYCRGVRQEELEDKYVDEVTSMAGYVADQFDETDLILEEVKE